MKTIIAGGRKYKKTDDDIRWLNAMRRILPITEVVSGCATGADKFGEEWAKANGIHVEPFPADWENLDVKGARIVKGANGRKYNAAAGGQRNEKMARYAEAVILFPGGKGTRDMRRRAEAHGLQIYKRVP